MPLKLQIVPTTQNVKIAEGKGELAFTVTNETGEPFRGQIKVRPADSSQQGWFQVKGPTERLLPADGTEAITIVIQPPQEGAPAGTYQFSIFVSSETNPDEEWAESQRVSFALAATQQKKSFPWWVIAAAAGGLALVIGVLAVVLSPKEKPPEPPPENVQVPPAEPPPLDRFAPQNLAAGKNASQSSTFETGAAARAVDGNRNGEWARGSVTHTQADAQAWWQVDLGAVTPVGEVVLYNRTDCCLDRLADFVVMLSNDGINWTEVAAFPGAAGPWLALPISGSGRFVQIRLHGTGILSLAEVEVYATQNLAIGKTASQSSIFEDAAASRANDGNRDGNWWGRSVSHTNNDLKAWWQVDLGQPEDIGRVVIYNRTDCCQERLANFEILLSDDGTTWTNATTFNSTPPTPAVFAIRKKARYVRVQLVGTNALHLAEVLVLRQ